MKTKTKQFSKAQESSFKYQFNEIFSIEDLQKLQDLFSDATGVASIITKPDGTPITQPSNFTRLCNDVIRKTEIGCTNCFRSDALIGCSSTSGPIVQPCLSGGLWDAGASISVGGTHIANWLIGQVRDKDSDTQDLMLYADIIGADKAEFLDALNEVPVMPQSQFRKVADMLFAYVNELSEKAYKNLQLKKEISERKKANELLQKSEESLYKTLHSIGDGVISTDINGYVTDMNPVAENLCGWKLQEAIGKPLIEIFNIVNSETREQVENPVEKVLSSGKIEGLANHTVLISKSGTEYQISDSAAPIVNSFSEISGVVLVFSDVTQKYAAESELLESERSKSVLLSNLPGVSYRCKYDREWTMEFISQGCLKLTGYESDDFLHNKKMSFNDIILPDYYDSIWHDWTRVVETNGTFNGEYQIRTATNEIKWVWEQGVPIFNSSGKIEALEGFIIDITDRKLAEEKLDNEKLLLRTLIDNIPDAIYIKDLESRKIIANKIDILNADKQTESDLIGKNDFDVFSKELAEKFHGDDKFVIETGTSLINREESIIHADGKIQWVLTSKVPLRDKNNKIVGIVGIARDITERKQKEEIIQNERILLRSIIDNIPDTIYAKDLVGNKILANKAEVKLLGAKSEAEVLGKCDFDFYSEEFAEKFKADDQLLIETGIPVINREGSIDDPNGEKHWLLSSKLPLYNNKNQIVGILGIGRNISIRKQMEDALRASENFLKQTQIIAQLGTYTFDIVNNKWESSEILDSIFGIDDNYIKTIESWESIIHPEWKKLMSEYFANEVIGNRTKFNKRYKILRPSDNEERWVHGLGELIFNDANEPVKMIGTIRDITKRRNMVEALRKSEALFRSILSASPDAIIVTDTVGRITKVSDSTVNMYGCQSDEEFIGHEIFEYLVPEDIKRAKEHFERIFDNPTGTVEYRFQLFNGTEIFAEVNADEMRNELGQAIGAVVIVRDISDRKLVEAELSNAQDELKKFASHLQNVREEERIGVAREIHDELGQILIAMKIDLGMLKKNVLNSIDNHAIANILTKFDDLFNLIDNTINTARRIMSNLRPEVLYLLGFIESAKLQTTNFAKKYNIECDFISSLNKLEIDTQQSVALYRILQESLSNIAKHSKATSVKVHLFIDDKKLILQITDNGIGFSKQQVIKQDAYGLIGMSERAFLLDGKFSISGQSGEGTTVKVEMPYNSK
jgi:PAS domain S-box-containing protein